jgi:hypothetical protein
LCVHNAQQHPVSAYRICAAEHIRTSAETGELGIRRNNRDGRVLPGGFKPKMAAAEKKKEFTGAMRSMLPGNSFPQICVVSESDYQ